MYILFPRSLRLLFEFCRPLIREILAGVGKGYITGRREDDGDYLSLIMIRLGVWPGRNRQSRSRQRYKIVAYDLLNPPRSLPLPCSKPRGGSVTLRLIPTRMKLTADLLKNYFQLMKKKLFQSNFIIEIHFKYISRFDLNLYFELNY